MAMFHVEHKKSLKDKKYLKGMFAFMAAYVEGEVKSAKKLEDDYVIAINDAWTKLDDGMYMTVIGTVINPFTGEFIQDYFDKKMQL